MKIDETALAAAIKAQNWHGATASMARGAVQAYLDALQKSEGVPVRICVAVTPDEKRWGSAGWHDSADDDLRDAAAVGMEDVLSVQYRWVEAVVRGYDAGEPTAQGVEVEG